MLPAAVTGDTVTDLLELLEPGDAIVDGGNSSYRDDIDRAEAAAVHDIDYVDCGTSGGVWGLERGYCLMIGGPDRAVDAARPRLRLARPRRRRGRPHPGPAPARCPAPSRATCTAARPAPGTS